MKVLLASKFVMPKQNAFKGGGTELGGKYSLKKKIDYKGKRVS